MRRSRYGIAKEGLPFILPFLLLTGICLLTGWTTTGIVSAGITLFLLYFFRDPERNPPQGDHLVLAPADGKILEIWEEKEEKGLTGIWISIFLSPFDVHVNRSPVTGLVKEIRYQPGRFFPAFSPRASTENEQNTVWIESPYGEVIVKQIVGILARRIVCWVKTGERIVAGSRLGLMKFGSRIDMWLPMECTLSIRQGDKVRAGETVVAKFLPSSFP